MPAWSTKSWKIRGGGYKIRVIVVFLIIIHLLLCLILYILARLSLLKCPRTIMPMVLLVPLWGLLVLLLLERRTRQTNPGHREVGIEKLKVNDFVQKSILVEENSAEERIVPLGEALRINKPLTRRELMMEIMYDNPNDYVELLKEAGTNDDTEVVHYAVTALAELQKDYDLKFQELERQIEQEPDNEELTDTYLELLNQYLNSGIAEGNDRKAKLRIYAGMLDKKLSSEPRMLSYCREKVQVNLQLGNYTDMYSDIDYIIRHWPSDETGYLLMIQYFSLVKNREGMEKIMGIIRKRNIHLTPDGRRQIRFWQKGEGVSEV